MQPGQLVLRSVDQKPHLSLHAQWLLLAIFVDKVFEIDLNFSNINKYKIRKAKGTFVLSNFKVNSLVLLVFLILYSLVPKIEICLQYFLDKNSQKQSLWHGF